MLAFLLVAPATVAAPSEDLKISMLEDSSGHWHIDDVASPAMAARFVPVAGTTVNFGFTRSAWWLRLDIDAPSQHDRVLELRYTQNDQLDLYLRTQDAWEHLTLGDSQLRSVGTLTHTTPAVLLTPDQQGPLFLRVVSEGSVLVPLKLESLLSFTQQSGREQFGYGLYYAVLLAMAVYNLFLYAAITERAYLYYAIYLAGLLLFQGAFFGHAAQWLWPQSQSWGHYALLTGIAITIAGGSRFVSNLAQTSRFTPAWHRALLAVTVAAFAIPPLMLIHYRSAAIFATALGAITMLVLSASIVLSYLRGCRQARYLVLGILSFLPGVTTFVLRTAGVVPSYWFTEHALQIGTAIETMLLSIALADRINILSAEKAAAQRATTVAHDEERRRIAQDLHDGLGQNLLLLSNRLRRLPVSVPGVETLREIADDSMAELRTAARNLYPHQLDRLGLGAALESMMAQTLGRAGIRHVSDITDMPLPRALALQLYRIAQEAISNIARHSQATEARLQLVHRGHRIELEIRDDGRGLPTPLDHGLGLPGMLSRAENLGGNLSIGTIANGGTRVLLSAPLDHA